MHCSHSVTILLISIVKSSTTISNNLNVGKFSFTKVVPDVDSVRYIEASNAAALHFSKQALEPYEP